MYKNAIRIVERCGNRVLSGNLFKKLQILRLIFHCLLTLLMFVVPEVKNVHFVPFSVSYHLPFIGLFFLLRLLKDRQRANGMAPSLRHQRRFIKLCNICDIIRYI